jgi:hypothetical protein
MMRDTRRDYVRDNSIGFGAIAALIVGALIVAGVIVWASDTYFRSTALHSPTSTVGQGASPASTEAPASITEPAAKIELNDGPAIKEFTIKKHDAPPQ